MKDGYSQALDVQKTSNFDAKVVIESRVFP